MFKRKNRSVVLPVLAMMHAIGKQSARLAREIWQVMTRLQNAEKQLSDALAALESAVESSIEASASSAIAATPSKADFAALIDEVSGIEAKLGEAMQVIADIDAAQTNAGNAGDVGNGDSDGNQ